MNPTPSSSPVPQGPYIANDPVGVYARSVRGELLPLRVWRGAARPRRVVVALHGMVTHAGWFAQLGELLVGRGLALIAPDRRGNGLARTVGDPGDIDLLVSDVAAVITRAHELCDDVTLLSWCGSANYAVPAVAHLPVQRLVLASPGLVPLEAMAARFREARPLAGFLPLHFDPLRDFTDDAEVQRAIRADKLTLRSIPLPLREAWRTLNPLARQALRTLHLPVRCVLARRDRMIDVPRTQALLAERAEPIAVDWCDGGHGFVAEPEGARLLAQVLEQR